MSRSVYGLRFEIDVEDMPPDEAAALAQTLVLNMMDNAQRDDMVRSVVDNSGGTLRWRFFANGWEVTAEMEPSETEIDMDVWGSVL